MYSMAVTMHIMLYRWNYQKIRAIWLRIFFAGFTKSPNQIMSGMWIVYEYIYYVTSQAYKLAAATTYTAMNHTNNNGIYSHCTKRKCVSSTPIEKRLVAFQRDLYAETIKNVGFIGEQWLIRQDWNLFKDTEIILCQFYVLMCDEFCSGAEVIRVYRWTSTMAERCGAANNRRSPFDMPSSITAANPSPIMCSATWTWPWPRERCKWQSLIVLCIE